MIIFSIIGALIGAGFASGQEIYIFFYKYGIYGIFGLILCSCLISYVIYKTLKICYKDEKIRNYKDFLNKIFYFKKNKQIPKIKYLNLTYITNLIVNVFLLMSFYIMISGFGTYFEEEFGINKILGSGILALCSYFILIKDIKGVTKANSVIVPILIVLIITIGIKNCITINLKNIDLKFNLSWILQSILYCSYNMILVIPVAVNLSKYIKSKKDIKIISIICGIIVFILALSIYLLLTNINKEEISKIEMPAIYSVNNKFQAYGLAYGIAVLLSIFSTEISAGISFLHNVTKDKKSFPQIVGIMCISGVLISNIGFSNLVKMLFPLFGYLGILQIVAL